MHKPDLKFFIVDHLDSFTYNLCDLIHFCSPSSEMSLNLSNDPNLVAKFDDFYIKNFDDLICVVFSPGPNSPFDQISSLKIYQKYKKSCVFLGICLGCQIIGLAHGFKIEKIKSVVHGRASKVLFKKNCDYYKDFNNAEFAFYNSLYLKNPDIKKTNKVKKMLNQKSNYDIDIIAYDEFDRIAVIESGFDKNYQKAPVLAMQFHPESFLSIRGFDFVRTFFKKCKIYGIYKNKNKDVSKH